MDPTGKRDAGARFSRLVELMARLRAPDGCPWDREQTFDSIKPYTLEETYEVLDAIDARDWRHLAEELGDLLLQVVFYAQMAEEAGHFTIEDSIDAINRKLVRRHPHVFGNAEANTAGEVKKRWDEIKAEERKESQRKHRHLLDAVPRALPALLEAFQIHSRAAATGFDWGSHEQVIEKLHEELAELEAARAGASQEEIEAELGDVLGTIVNLARFLKVDPEQAMRKANARFRRRFNAVESALKEQGKSFADTNIDEMEELWQQAKRSE